LIAEIDRRDERALERFVRMERELVGHEPLFWSEPDADVLAHLSGRSALSQEMDACLLVVEGSARCAALVNRGWQAQREPDTGCVGWFAAGPGREAEVVELLCRAEEWLAARGVRRVIAPFNGTALLGLGVLTGGFGESPMFPFPWNPAYYPDYLERAGYAKAYPFYLYEIDFRSERYREATRNALQDAQCSLRPVDKRRWEEELDLLRRLFNEGFDEEWEFHRYSREQFDEVYAPLKRLFDRHLIQFAEVDGEPAGFVIGFPDFTPWFQSFAGRLGPIESLRLMRARGRVRRIGLFAIGIVPRHRGKRIGRTLAASLYRELERRGFESSNYYLVNESNAASRALAMSFGARERLLYHCYEKHLD
jgi:GNAT superfamily N-acetyltransferase